MAYLQISYRGNVVAERPLPLQDTLTMKTAGKYCEDDIVVSSGSGLPSSYQETEYLEGDGNQYIETRTVPAYGETIDIGFRITTIDSNYRSIIGAAVTGDYGNLYLSTNRVDAQVTQSWLCNVPIYPALTANVLYDATINVNSGCRLFLNGAEVSYGGTPNYDASLRPLILFGRNANDAKMIGRIYKCHVFNSANEPRGAFIPCYRKSDNKPGFYDTVKSLFYVNNGSGEFVVGPDV